jgi:hypothetical protein
MHDGVELAALSPGSRSSGCRNRFGSELGALFVQSVNGIYNITSDDCARTHARLIERAPLPLSTDC